MRFLGLSGCYRCFCKNFSTIVEPLTNLLRKDKKFEWQDRCQIAFETVKAMLMHKPVLYALNFQKPFKVAVDASDVGAGAVLLQEDDQGVEHPICYFSKKFEKGQKNYCTSEKELLALVLALQHFELYVSAGDYPLTDYTDHNPLVFLHRLKNKNQRLLRWSILLQQYNLAIKHIRGQDNVIADTLSWAGSHSLD